MAEQKNSKESLKKVAVDIPNMCTVDDILYMNERIDFITGIILKLSSAYKYVLEGTASQNAGEIKALRDVAVAEVSRYYAYIESRGIRPEESYLTHWMEVYDTQDLLNDTEQF